MIKSEIYGKMKWVVERWRVALRGKKVSLFTFYLFLFFTGN